MRQRLGYLINLPLWLTVSSAFSLYSSIDTRLLLVLSCRSPFLGYNDCPLYPTHSPLYSPTWLLSSRASKKPTEREFLAERVSERMREIQEPQADFLGEHGDIDVGFRAEQKAEQRREIYDIG